MNKPKVNYNGTRSEVVDFIPNQYSRVLEIGCGKGGFRANLVEDCEYWGIEPVEEIAKLAADKLDKVLIGVYDDVVDNIPDDYFDLIICNDVIEHMIDHKAFYESIKQKVKPQAYMVGSIPNVRFLANLDELLRRKDWKYVESGILDKTHLRFFTEKSIKEDFTNHNFKIEKFIGINEVKYTWKNKYEIFMNILKFILGDDTKFLQFGFRVRLR